MAWAQVESVSWSEDWQSSNNSAITVDSGHLIVIRDNPSFLAAYTYFSLTELGLLTIRSIKVGEIQPCKIRIELVTLYIKTFRYLLAATNAYEHHSG